MSRKISLSFLGTGGYRSTDYFFPGEHQAHIFTTPLMQVALQDYLQRFENFGYEDRHVVFLTDKARRENYLSAKKPFGQDAAHHTGLKAELNKANYKSLTIPVTVASGHDQDSILDTLDKMIESVQPGDQVYLDITHGFRSFPMLAVVISDILKLTKQAEVKAIFYGCFEDSGYHGNKAPVYNLDYLTELQQISAAAYAYTNYGFVEPLSILSKEVISPELKRTKGKHPTANALKSIIKSAEDLARQLRTNRGNELYKGEAIGNLRNHYEQLPGDSKLERGPLRLIIGKIAERGQNLQQNGNLNWLHAARLAYADGLVQQTCSLLREGAVSYVCRCNNLNPGKATDRELVEKALNAVGNNIPQEQYDPPLGAESVFQSLTEDVIVNKIASKFAALTPIRNDLMHAGYYTEEGPHNARTSKRIYDKIKGSLQDFEGLLL